MWCRVQDPGNKDNATYIYERVDTFSWATTRGISSKSVNVTSKPVTVKKSATTPSTANRKYSKTNQKMHLALQKLILFPQSGFFQHFSNDKTSF